MYQTSRYTKFQVSIVFRFVRGWDTGRQRKTQTDKEICQKNVRDPNSSALHVYLINNWHKLLTLNLYYNSDALVFINKILMRQITYLHLVISALPSHSFLLRLSTSFWTIREVIWSNCDLISIVSACAFFYFVLSHFRYLFDLLLHITIFVTSKFENI